MININNALFEQTNPNLSDIDFQLHQTDPVNLIEWSAKTFGDGLVMSTSFGIDSAVMLHMVTRIKPNVPVIWIDTGYLPPETYAFAEQLTTQLNLNLKVYQPLLSPARMEAIYGKLWEQQDLEALNLYDRLRKVEPMQRALQELKATAWLAGLRSHQTEHRRTLSRIERQQAQYKILPLLNWQARDVYQYLTEYLLPYHPLFEQGYVTVGDWHSSRSFNSEQDSSARDTRFHGLKQECGLHL